MSVYFETPLFTPTKQFSKFLNLCNPKTWHREVGAELNKGVLHKRKVANFLSDLEGAFLMGFLFSANIFPIRYTQFTTLL